MRDTTLRPELEPMPPRIGRLPRSRGYPVPWFVGWVDGEPEFRCMDRDKLARAVRDKLCWVCGDKLGRNMTFVAGPMCGVNRNSAEPPCHLDCARWSARNCPFLSRPHAKRREDEFTEGAPEGAGVMIRRNPGVTMLWTTRGYRVYPDGGGLLFDIGTPEHVEWWSEGKPATRAQVEASVASGLPLLEEIARQQPGAPEELDRMRAAFEQFLPAA
jgi:hypothetical protein